MTKLTITRREFDEIRSAIKKDIGYLQSRIKNGWSVEPEDTARALLAMSQATILMFEWAGRSMGYIKEAEPEAEKIIPAAPETETK